MFAPDPRLTIVVHLDGMREIRFEYRLPPEGSDGSAPSLRGQRTGTHDVEGAHVRVVLDTDQQLGPVLLARLLGYAG